MTSNVVARIGVLGLALLLPAGAMAQGVAIEHNEIGCIVAGKYPKMNACFSPASLVGKARVYFRPETLSTWYYVDMTSDAPCFSGVLLKPSKALIDKKIFYYLDVQGGGTGRTPEYGPVVVGSEEECRSKLPIAPLSATGPAAVYPSFPAGFVGGAGVSTGVVAGGVAAAAVIAGGAVLLTDDDDDGPTVTTPGTTPVTNPPVTTPPPPTTPPTTVPNRPGLLVACQANPRSGDAPLRVDFATFPSGGDGTYEFSWDFEDGGSATNPNPSHTFVSAGVFNATVRVTSAGLVAACSRSITVTSPPPPPVTTPPAPTLFKLHVTLAGSGNGTVTGTGINCPGDCDEAFTPGTVVALTAAPAPGGSSIFVGWAGDCTGTGPCTVTMTADRNVTAKFEVMRTLTVTAAAGDIAGSVVSSPPGINCSWNIQVPCTDTATFINGTIVTLTVTTGGARTVWGGACAGTTGTVCTVLMDANKAADIQTFRTLTADTKSADAVRLTSQLEVPDGEGQVMVNGEMASGAARGLASATARARAGANRVEALLVRGTGRPGTWRFDFGGQATFRTGSIRVVAGTVALVTGDAVLFRLRGHAGERIVFTFEVAP